MQNTPKVSLLMRAYQTLWSRRLLVSGAIIQLADGLSEICRRLPVPDALRAVTAELFYNAVEHFIVRSSSYQGWLQHSSGLGRLHSLLGKEEPASTAPLAIFPTEQEWQNLQQQTPPDRAQGEMAVIVPVYGGYTETLRCLYQVLTSKNDISFKLCVINDASPDSNLTDQLNALGGQGWFELINHRENAGFVRSVNEGMQRYGNCDIVLLNADTEVYDGWLDRMHTALYSSDKIASVTPLSNNAELCSYPQIFSANPQMLELSYAELDILAAQQKPSYPHLPTGVGFCMAMRRAALDELGLFDAEAFGRGYGEENDWCLRASAKGWLHIAADNVFVRHHGNVSFSADKKHQLKQSLRKLNRRYPYYRALIRNFKRDDPLKSARQKLDIARLQRYCQQDKAILMINHNAGGGTERHISDMSSWLAEENVDVFRLSPDDSRTNFVRLWHESMAQTTNLSFDLDAGADALIELLKLLGISHLHIHHLIGFAPAMREFINLAVRRLNCAYDVTIHDYYFACPSVNLLVDGEYVKDNPTLEQSEKWARSNPSPAGRMPIWQWREQHLQLLQNARRVYAPSEDVVQRMKVLFPDVEMVLREHPEKITTAQDVAVSYNDGEEVNIAIIGRLVAHKGYEVVRKLAQDAKDRGLNITYHVFGDTQGDAVLAATGRVRVHGKYAEGSIGHLLRDNKCHIALFPSIWPETYSYTLSIALLHGVYPVCFDLGAPAKRLRSIDWGVVLPCSQIEQPIAVNDILFTMQASDPPTNLGLALKTQCYPSLWRDYYHLPE